MPDGYHKKFNAKCYQCGKCCTYIAILHKKDIELIKKTGLSEEQFVDKQHPVKKTLKHENGHCMFLKFDPEGNNYCSIYDHRPGVCRIFPDKNRNVSNCTEYDEGYAMRKLQGAIPVGADQPIYLSFPDSLF